MAIDRESGITKHLISTSPVSVTRPGGRGGLANPTYCGWIYNPARMEGGHPYGNWWLNPDIPDVCALCVHRAECTVNECVHCTHIASCETSNPKTCDGCGKAASAPLPDAPTY